MRKDFSVDWSAQGNYTTTLLTDEAVAVISRHDPSTASLFLYVPHSAPHTGNRNDPLQAPAETVALFGHIPDPKRRIYAAMVYEMDKSVGRLVAALKARDMLDDSIIIFSGDNGGAVNGMDRNVASNWPLRGAKNTTWEGGVRTSGILWSPWIPEDRRGSVMDHLMDITDWLPTLFEAAGGNPLDLGPIDGLSQWEAIVDSTAVPRRVELVHNIDDVFGYAGIRKGDYKLVLGSTEEGLFDGWYGPSGHEDGGRNITEAQYLKEVESSDAGKCLKALNMSLKVSKRL